MVLESGPVRLLKIGNIYSSRHECLSNYGWHLSRCVIVMLLMIFIDLANKDAHAGRYFHLEKPKFGLGLYNEYESEDREGPNIDSDATTNTVKEYLDFETKGWAYHPAFLLHHIRLRPEWEQAQGQLTIANTGGGKRDEDPTRDKFLLGYFIDLTFLQYKPYTLDLFAKRGRSTLKSSFARRSDTEGETYGASLRLKYQLLPTSIGYIHTNYTQRGFYTSNEERDDLRLHMRHNTTSSNTSLHATYTDKTRTTSGHTIKSEVSNVSLKNNYNITADKSILLRSLVSYRSTDTATSTDIVGTDTAGIVFRGYGLSESLNWRHKKNLRTNYNLYYDSDKYGDFNRETGIFTAGLTHIFKKDLTTTITTNYSADDFTGGKENYYSGRANFAFRRSIPWGTLNLNIGQGYRITERDIIETTLQVIDEEHTLITGDVNLLENKYVDSGQSITVTNEFGSIVYIENIDYKITEVDSFGYPVPAEEALYTRISRTTFGNITDGQEVLVSYQYLSNPAYDYSTFSQSYGANLYLWSAWRLYYRYNRTKDDFESGIPPDELTENTTHTTGTQFRWKWTDTSLTYNDTDTTYGISVSRWLAKEVLTFKPAKRLYLYLSVHYGEIEFKDSGETEILSGVRSNIQVMLTKRSRLKIEGFNDRITGAAEKTIDTGFSGLYEWFYGIWNVNIQYIFLNQEDQINNEMKKYHHLLFEIKRKLW